MPKLYAALLVLFCFCLQVDVNGQSIINPADTIRTFAAGSSPTLPAYGSVAKWGRTADLGWNTSEWKCYIYNGTPFRIHFPKSYTTAVDGKIYPVFLFLHGVGEAGQPQDNEQSLYHGGQIFQSEIDNGLFDGYCIVPQSEGGWGPANYQNIIPVINYMIANNKVDFTRIVVNGLSGGGAGSWEIADDYPQYFAGVMPMSAMCSCYSTTAWVNNMKFTAYWDFQGGQDGSPDPYTASEVNPYFYNAGANYTYTEFITQGHDTWDSAWEVPSFFPFVGSQHLNNPWPLFGHTTFCPGAPISVTMGMAPGAQGYQWRLNGTVIPGATSNQITVTAVGTYDAAVEFNGVWSAWSPNPVVVSVQGSTQTPPITLLNPQTVTIPGTDATDSVTLSLPTGDSLYAWYKVGSAAVIGTTPTLKVGGLGGPGDYYATVIPRFGCSAIPSPPFQIVNAGGPNAPTAATNPVASAAGFTKVQLTWATQPNPAHAPTGFEIYRAAKSGGPYTYLNQTSPTTLTYIDSAGLLAGTKYFYVVRAIDTTGAAPLSPEASAKTNSDTIPPTGPTGLTAQFTTSSTIGLIWNHSTDNASVDHYNVYVNGQLSNVTKDTTFVLNSLTQGSWYAIYVTAVDPSGNQSVHSPQISAEAINSGLIYNYYTSPNTNLTSVQNLTTLSPVTTGTGPNVNINLFTATTTTNFGYVWHGYITIPVTGTYYFATASDDGSALWFNSSVPLSDAAATVNNDNLQGVTQKNSSAMNLTAGTYPICIAYFQQGGGYSMSVLWSCTALNGNATYVAIPNQYFAGTATSPGATPARPTHVKATATAYNQINLTWTDNSNNETGFEVYRATSASGPFGIVTTTPANTTSFSDIGLTGSTAYYYKVQAINTAGGSGYDSLSVGGLNYNLYSGTFGSPMPNFYTQTPVASGNADSPSVAPAGSYTVNFGLLFSGNLKAPVTGTYTFSTNSDDASALFIGGYPGSAYEVVNNDFQQGATTRTGTIALTAGQYYPFYVAYDQGTGGYTLTTYWKLPGSSVTTIIPDSAFANPNWTATTLPAPKAPVTPSLTVTTTSSSKITLTWTDTSRAISGYTLQRSLNDSLHFQFLATIAGTATSYVDSSLFGHQTYYYKLMATNPTGSSLCTPALSATTLDNPPVVASVPNQSARYSTTTTINLSATDPDGDNLTFTGLALPPFATLTDNGNGTAVLTLNPIPSQAGTYVGMGATVSDGHGGTTNIAFTLTVNNNYPPVLASVSPLSVNTNATVKVPLTATDQSGNSLTFKVTGLPNNYSLTPGAYGTDTLVFTPTLAATGSYTATVTVNDSFGGISTTTFPVTVVFVTPTKTVYLRVNDGDAVGAPWNNFTSQITTGLLDMNGNNTNWTFNLNTSWWGGAALGPTTGNNSGVYPDNVMKDFWFFAYAGGPATVDPIITGLDTTQLYNITLFGSSIFNWVANNGTTIYSSQGQTDSLYVQNNQTNTVTLTNLKPDNTGSITFHMAVTAGTPVGYLNALVINQLFDDGTLPLSPHNLTASLTGSNVTLNWSDSAYNEAGYEVWRGTSATGPFTLLTNALIPKTTTYTDTTAFGFTTYYYEVRAYNRHGDSYYSNVASVTTPDKVPTLNPLGNVSIGWGTDTTINVTTSGGGGNTIALTASNLPAFVTFRDNGNGTGALTINVPDSTSGNFAGLTVTMTDIADSVRTQSFNLTVKNPLISTVYIHYSDGIDNGATPWNNINIWPGSGFSQTNLLNDANLNSGLTMTYQNGFQGFNNSGDITGNNSGIFPDGVMGSCLFDAGSQTDSILISGLNPAAQYTFGVFSSSNWQVAGPTNFSLLGTTQTINPAYNTNNLLQWKDVTVRPNGTVSLGVTKSTAAQYSFLNDLIIQSYDTTKLKIIGPSNLQATAITRSAVTLHWTDNSWNETGFEVWRATDASGGTYSRLAVLAPNTITYKDSSLASNSTYYYTVRAVKGSLPSTYSNPVGATTTSYAVYMEFNEPGQNIAPLPWNAMNQAPSNGTTWKNLHDDQGNPTSTGAVINGLFDVTALGTTTGNNSGVVPDAVMVDNYLVFSGGSASIILNGLNIQGLYDVTFFNSFFQSDVVTRFTVNGQPVILDASLNTSATITAYRVKPDQFGQITVTITPNLQTTAYATLNAIILRGYSPDANSVPTTPVTAQQASQTKTMTNVTNDAAAPSVLASGDTVIAAYPNPFKATFTLQVPAVSDDKALVEMYATDGKLVYANEFANLIAGTNYLTVTPSSSLQTGVYIVKVRTKAGNLSKVIKLMKQ